MRVDVDRTRVEGVEVWTGAVRREAKVRVGEDMQGIDAASKSRRRDD